MEKGATYRRTNIIATLQWSGLYGMARLKPLLSEDNPTFRVAKKHPKNFHTLRNKICPVCCTSIPSFCRKPGTAHYLHNTIQTVKHCGGSSFMLWGCFSATETRGLDTVKRKFNAEKYSDILNETWFRAPRLGRSFTFQQDSDHKHKAKTMQEWLIYTFVNALERPSHTLKKNCSKQYQKRVLRLVTIAEPF